jgi:DNA-binding NarL/FixJ family response regulator
LTITVFIADDHVLVRQVLRSLLEAGGIAVTGEAADGEQAIELAGRQPADVMVLDLSMPRGSGLQVAATIRDQGLPIAILVVSAHADSAHVLAALKNGARGFILKNSASASLVEGVRTLHEGGYYFCPAVRQAVPPAVLQRRFDRQGQPLPA